MALVSVEPSHQGAITRLASWDTATFPGKLEFFHHDDKPQRFPPECAYLPPANKSL